MPMISRSFSEQGVALFGVIALVLLTSLVVVAFSFSALNAAKRNLKTTQNASILKTGINNHVLDHARANKSTLPTLDDLVTDVTATCAFDNNPLRTATYLSLQGWCGPSVDQTFAEDPNDFKTD